MTSRDDRYHPAQRRILQQYDNSLRQDAGYCACSNPTKVVLRGSADASCAACGADWPDDQDDDQEQPQPDPLAAYNQLAATLRQRPRQASTTPADPAPLGLFEYNNDDYDEATTPPARRPLTDRETRARLQDQRDTLQNAADLLDCHPCYDPGTHAALIAMIDEIAQQLADLDQQTGNTQPQGATTP